MGDRQTGVGVGGQKQTETDRDRKREKEWGSRGGRESIPPTGK